MLFIIAQLLDTYWLSLKASFFFPGYDLYLVFIPLPLFFFQSDSQGTCSCQDRRKEVGVAVYSVE